MKISVAMTTYNGEKFLPEQLESLRLQSRPADEVIIVDDRSTDGTLDLLMKYRGDHPDFPVRIFENRENQGYKRNFHIAAKKTTGDLILFCDQDDMWAEEKIETLAGMMEEHPEMLTLASSYDLIDGSGNPVTTDEWEGWCNHNLYHRVVGADELVRVPLTDLLLHNFCQGCAEIIRREVLGEFIRGYHGRIPHDWYVNLVAASRDGLYFYNHPLFHYRIHGGNALGLRPDITWKDKFSAEYRTLDARQSRDVIRDLRKIAPDLFVSSGEEPEEEENPEAGKVIRDLGKRFSHALGRKIRKKWNRTFSGEKEIRESSEGPDFGPQNAGSEAGTEGYDASSLREIRIYPDRAETAAEVREQEKFIRGYLDAVRNKKTVYMLSLYDNPRYREFRSREGWAADVACTVFQKRPKI